MKAGKTPVSAEELFELEEKLLELRDRAYESPRNGQPEIYYALGDAMEAIYKATSVAASSEARAARRARKAQPSGA